MRRQLMRARALIHTGNVSALRLQYNYVHQVFKERKCLNVVAGVVAGY